MKRFLLLLLVSLAFVSCKNEKDASENVMADVIEKSVTETVEELSSDIPILDFSALESAYFHPENEKIYVLNFWATWCKPCIKELPAFEELNATYSNRNVEVILVSLDFPNVVNSRVVPFLQANLIQSKVVLLDDADANSWITAVDATWSGAIPATLIIKKGTSQFYERSFTFEELETEIKTIL